MVAVRPSGVGLIVLAIALSIPVTAWPDPYPPSTLQASPCTTYESVHPVTTEWTMWLGGGAAGVRDEGDASGTAIEATFVARAGVGISFGPDEPSRSTGFGLRVGPWLGAELDPSLLLPSDEDLWDPLTRPSDTTCVRYL